MLFLWTLSVNYRGTIGYGQRFGTCLLGHIGDYDVQDVKAAFDFAATELLVDVDRAVVCGGSCLVLRGRPAKGMCSCVFSRSSHSCVLP